VISTRDFETARGTARGLAAGDDAMRIVSPSLWIAETYTFIEGVEEKVQTYRFTRP
jgi:hypothetical protein